MTRTAFRLIALLAVIAAAVVSLPSLGAGLRGQSTPLPSTKNGEWPMYTADLAGSKYSPLSQIDAGNFNKLEVAWRFKTDNLGPRPENKLEGTPIMIRDTIYATAGTRRAIIALNAQTGEMKWMYAMDEGPRALAAPRQLSGRGLSYWTDGKGDERIVFVTIGYRYSTNAKGLVRAFDARTGKQIWRFNTIPYPGEPGNETWESGSWEWTGNVGVWTQITVDPEAGLVYLPVESPTIDEYGGNRPGNNLYAESLVAVELKTGKKKWHFQLVHHPLWDHDISSAPLLIDAVIDGRPRKLVAQPTKQSFLYVFDRITGQPIWPMPETAVPQTDLPGEKTSPTQPIPSKPPAYARTHVTTDDLIDFTPALRAQALENLKKFRWEPTPYIPPVMARPDRLGSINVGNTVGGINWPGAAFDPETATFYGQANNSSITSRGFTQAYFDQVKPENQSQNRIPIWEAEPVGAEAAIEAGGRGGALAGRGRGAGRGPSTVPGQPPATTGAPGAPGATPAAPAGGGRGGGLTTGLEGLPFVKPPYGVLTAIDLNKGEIKFKVPHGDTPDNVRAALERLGISYPEKTGQGGSVGLMVTKTLVVVGDPQFTAPPGRTRGAMLRAYDKNNGKEVGAVWIPAPQSGSPMTYMMNGRQYILVAVSGGNVTGEYIAFALPNSEVRSTSQGQP